MYWLHKDWVGGVQHKEKANSSVLTLTRVSERMNLDLFSIDGYTIPMIPYVFVIFAYKKSNVKRYLLQQDR